MPTTSVFRSAARSGQPPASMRVERFPATTSAAPTRALARVSASWTARGSRFRAASAVGSSSTVTWRGRPPMIVTSEMSGISFSDSCICAAIWRRA